MMGGIKAWIFPWLVYAWLDGASERSGDSKEGPSPPSAKLLFVFVLEQ